MGNVDLLLDVSDLTNDRNIVINYRFNGGATSTLAVQAEVTYLDFCDPSGLGHISTPIQLLRDGCR